MPDINLAAAFRNIQEKGCSLNEVLLETFAEYSTLIADYAPEDLERDALLELFCEKLESQERVWYKVPSVVVSGDFGL